MNKYLTALLFFSFSQPILASDLSSPLILDFSAKMISKISKDEVLPTRGNKNGFEERYSNYSLNCNKDFKGCSISIFEMPEEYCNGIGKANSLDVGGYNMNLIEGVKVAHKENQLRVSFKDNSLYGETENIFFINYRLKKNKVSTHEVTGFKGNAVALDTTFGKIIRGEYVPLVKPVYCSAGFFPLEK